MMARRTHRGCALRVENAAPFGDFQEMLGITLGIGTKPLDPRCAAGGMLCQPGDNEGLGTHQRGRRSRRADRGRAVVGGSVGGGAASATSTGDARATGWRRERSTVRGL